MSNVVNKVRLSVVDIIGIIAKVIKEHFFIQINIEVYVLILAFIFINQDIHVIKDFFRAIMFVQHFCIINLRQHRQH